jgi:hypothetical protein
MLEIIRDGLVENDEQLLALIKEHEQAVIPSDDDLVLTHWWVIRDDGVETLYVGTAETFDGYVREQNGDVQ